jgi:sulfate adenylyltransferase
VGAELVHARLAREFTYHYPLCLNQTMINAEERHTLIPPYGDRLVNLMVADGELADYSSYANSLSSIQLSERAVCDLELLAVGAFSPLDRFMGQSDYHRVLNEARLNSGYLFPLPITLPVTSTASIKLDQDIALRSGKNELLAVMTVEEIYPWHIEEESRSVFGTHDPRHPVISEMYSWGRFNISGRLRVLSLPRRYDFKELRLSPQQTREKLSSSAHHNVVAFQTRNPLHRAHEEMVSRAMLDTDGVLLLHPVVGMTKPGDINYYYRVRTYKAWVQLYPEPSRILLSLLPLAMRMAGPKEALWHALIRRNYGANYLIIGRDHASPGLNSMGTPFYAPYEAHDYVSRFSDELGVGIIPFREFVYLPEERRYEESSNVPPSSSVFSLSGTEVREDYLSKGRKLPDWFMHPAISSILSEAFPPLHRQGFCIWLTGLSGAGKTTIADILTILLQEGGRQVTVLDGDVVRTHLSKGLGFSKEDRDIHIRRIGFMASEIVRHYGIAVCAAVSPYSETRDSVRNMVGTDNFIEVFVNTPLEVCEQRDTKGMYAKARSGQISNFTGIDDPYEPPLQAEVTLETVDCSAEDNVQIILNYLIKRGFIREDFSGLPANVINL